MREALSLASGEGLHSGIRVTVARGPIARRQFDFPFDEVSGQSGQTLKHPQVLAKVTDHLQRPPPPLSGRLLSLVLISRTLDTHTPVTQIPPGFKFSQDL